MYGDGWWQSVRWVAGVLTKIHVIPYVISVKTRFGTKPQIMMNITCELNNNIDLSVVTLVGT